jgi:mono/diheme cytochrome c family protein
MNKWQRLRARSAAILIVVFTLLPIVSLAEQIVADDRVLRVKEGNAVRQYTIDELVAAVGLAELKLAKDPYLGPNRIFAGFELESLLNHIGLGDASELLLVCADGYQIPFDTSVLSQSDLRGFLAIRDTALPVNAGVHWPPYQHGAEIINFDPFYLVWASAASGADPDTKTLPWPYQLTEIQRFDRVAYFAPARPPAAAGEAARTGFGIYTEHCGKCHRMRGVGGDLGPVLDREGSLSSVFTTAQLSDFVRHDSNLYPGSKMPQFSKTLSSVEIDQLVAYLQAMQPGNAAR